ncbi:MAG TPA: hypothetical protein VL551_34125 [Actinospica sp.]|nr:hypothetical protein [Actinospica sp.]
MLMIVRFATASLAIHTAAEDHRLVRSEIPVTAIMVTASRVPETTQLPRGRGPQAGAEAVRAHAERLGAAALVITTPTATARVRPGPDAFARTPLTDTPTPQQAPGHGQRIPTAAYWPALDLIEAL